MPRHSDPELEGRILTAADSLWRRGGQKALTMRAVAKAARTNTPAVYRRFRDREDLLRGLVRRTVARLRQQFEAQHTLEEMADAYVAFALSNPHEYQLFYTHGRLLTPKKETRTKTPLREWRPNFALVEQAAAKELGGSPDDYTQMTLQLWSLLHGMAMLVLSKSVPEEHQSDLRQACRAAVRALLANARK